MATIDVIPVRAFSDNYVWTLVNGGNAAVVDPGDAARVVSGPAPWQLAALPLRLDGDTLTVAAPFVGRLGFAQPTGGPAGP